MITQVCQPIPLITKPIPAAYYIFLKNYRDSCPYTRFPVFISPECVGLDANEYQPCYIILYYALHKDRHTCTPLEIQYHDIKVFIATLGCTCTIILYYLYYEVRICWKLENLIVKFILKFFYSQMRVQLYKDV